QEGGSVVVPISQVEPGLKQPRKRFDDDALSDLSDSIREHGLIQPLTVRRLASGYYQIIAGERRWRASKLAGLTEVPVMVIEADDRKVMELGLIENLQREDLNPMEEANGYASLADEYGMTQEEISLRMGKSRSAVANAMRLTSLPDSVRYLLEEGALSAGHGKALLSIPSAEYQKRLAQKAVKEGLSVRQTELLAKKIAAQPERAEKVQPSEDPDRIYLTELEKFLSSRYGRKVSILKGKKAGKIELEYYDPEDLENLLNQMGYGEAGGEFE
ncbi:MAG: ParB/RepB/Spo0J family partition protein, partial [Pseudoflavonifractor sp.]